MNLTVSPMNLNSCNCPKPQVKFEALPIRVTKFSKDESTYLYPSIRRFRDMVADKFSDCFETAAKKIHLDTDKLKDRGYVLEFTPKGEFSKDMSVSVVPANDVERRIITLPKVDNTLELRIAATNAEVENYVTRQREPFAESVKIILNA